MCLHSCILCYYTIHMTARKNAESSQAEPETNEQKTAVIASVSEAIRIPKNVHTRTWGAGVRWTPLPKAEAPTEPAGETDAGKHFLPLNAQTTAFPTSHLIRPRCARPPSPQGEGKKAGIVPIRQARHGLPRRLRLLAMTIKGSFIIRRLFVSIVFKAYALIDPFMQKAAEIKALHEK